MKTECVILPKSKEVQVCPPAIPAEPLSDNAIDFDFLESLAFAVPTKGLQRRSMESRARIIDVASAAFMNKGYAAVSTHEISAEAGVTQGLITYHFKSKEGLWQAAMDQVFSNFRNLLLEKLRELRGKSVRIAVDETIRRLVQISLQYPSLTVFMVESGAHADEHLLWIVERHIQPIYNAIQHIFEVGRRQGVLRDLPLTNAYYVLLTSGSIFSLDDEVRAVSGQDVHSDSFAEDHTRCMLTMLMKE